MSVFKIEKLLSNSLAFLERTAALCGTIDDADNLPSVFSEVHQSVTLVWDILQGALEQLKAGTVGTDDDELVKTLKSTKNQARLLESIFKIVAPVAETPRLDRYNGRVQNEGKDRVEVVLFRLLEYTNELVDEEVIEATSDQAQALHDAVEHLSAMEPSVPEDKKAGFVHSGSGDMINNTDSGTQNINKGPGTQNIAKIIKIGK